MPHLYFVNNKRFTTSLTALCLFLGHLNAQDEPPPEGWLHNVSGAYLHQTDSDLKDGGDFGLDQFTLQYGLSNFLPDGNVYGLSLRYSWWGYDFNNPQGLGQSKPWDDIAMIDFGVPLFYKLENGWDLFAVPTLRATAESGAGFSDGITAGGLIGASRKFSDTLTIGPGIGMYSEIEDSANIFPLVVVKWKLDDFWTVETGGGLGATLGPGVYLNYDPDKKLRFQFGGRYESLRFRIDDDGIAPEGVGEDKNFSFVAGARYSPNRAMQFSAFAGTKFSGTLTLDDTSGIRLHRQNYDGSLFFGAAFKLYFQ